MPSKKNLKLDGSDGQQLVRRWIGEMFNQRPDNGTWDGGSMRCVLPSYGWWRLNIIAAEIELGGGAVYQFVVSARKELASESLVIAASSHRNVLAGPHAGTFTVARGGQESMPREGAVLRNDEHIELVGNEAILVGGSIVTALLLGGQPGDVWINGRMQFERVG